MLFLIDFFNKVDEKAMIATTIIIIFYLIFMELVSASKEKNAMSKTFNPIAFILIIIFVLIAITKVMAVLK